MILSHSVFAIFFFTTFSEVFTDLSEGTLESLLGHAPTERDIYFYTTLEVTELPNETTPNPEVKSPFSSAAELGVNHTQQLISDTYNTALDGLTAVSSQFGSGLISPQNKKKPAEENTLANSHLVSDSTLPDDKNENKDTTEIHFDESTTDNGILNENAETASDTTDMMTLASENRKIRQPIKLPIEFKHDSSDPAHFNSGSIFSNGILLRKLNSFKTLE